MKREQSEQPAPSEDEADTEGEEMAAKDEAQETVVSPQAPPEEEGVRDQLLRLRADFDNFRKRTSFEKQQLSRYALEPAACDIMDALDDMERALKSPEHGDEEWRRGVEMIYNKILGAMEKHGVKQICTENTAFDPNLHEALTAIPSPDVEQDTVKEEIQKGYMLHDKVIRHAKVVVSTAEADGAEKNERKEDENHINEIEGDE